MAALSISHETSSRERRQPQPQTPAIDHAAPEAASARDISSLFETLAQFSKPQPASSHSSLFDTSAASAEAATPPPAADPTAGSSLFDTPAAPANPSAAQPTVNQLQFRVAAALASGKSVTAAAADAGLHRSTIYRWLDNSPVFKHLYETARRDYVETLRDDLRDLSGLALATIEDLMTNPKTPPSVRLRAALAVLTRPQFPNPGWSLPERIEPDYQRHLQDQLAAVHADYDIMRMSRSMAAPSPLAAAVHHKSTESGSFAGLSSAQPARNALCPCGSGKKYKRCCGQSAPPVISGFNRA